MLKWIAMMALCGVEPKVKGEDEIINVGGGASEELVAGRGTKWGSVSAETVRELGSGQEVEGVAG